MSAAAVAKEAVKEAVLGTTEPVVEVSPQTKQRFTSHAVKDESGELFLGLDEFVAAVVPKGEDFVSQPGPPQAPPQFAHVD